MCCGKRNKGDVHVWKNFIRPDDSSEDSFLEAEEGDDFADLWSLLYGPQRVHRSKCRRVPDELYTVDTVRAPYLV